MAKLLFTQDFTKFWNIKDAFPRMQPSDYPHYPVVITGMSDGLNMLDVVVRFSVLTGELRAQIEMMEKYLMKKHNLLIKMGFNNPKDIIKLQVSDNGYLIATYTDEVDTYTVSKSLCDIDPYRRLVVLENGKEYRLSNQLLVNYLSKALSSRHENIIKYALDTNQDISLCLTMPINFSQIEDIRLIRKMLNGLNYYYSLLNPMRLTEHTLRSWISPTSELIVPTEHDILPLRVQVSDKIRYNTTMYYKFLNCVTSKGYSTYISLRKYIDTQELLKDLNFSRIAIKGEERLDRQIKGLKAFNPVAKLNLANLDTYFRGDCDIEKFKVIAESLVPLFGVSVEDCIEKAAYISWCGMQLLKGNCNTLDFSRSNLITILDTLDLMTLKPDILDKALLKIAVDVINGVLPLDSTMLDTVSEHTRFMQILTTYISVDTILYNGDSEITYYPREVFDTTNDNEELE